MEIHLNRVDYIQVIPSIVGGLVGLCCSFGLFILDFEHLLSASIMVLPLSICVVIK